MKNWQLQQRLHQFDKEAEIVISRHHSVDGDVVLESPKKITKISVKTCGQTHWIGGPCDCPDDVRTVEQTLIHISDGRTPKRHGRRNSLP